MSISLHLIQPRAPFGPPERVSELVEVWKRSDGLFTHATHPGGRPTFSDLLTLCRPGMVNVIANADIFFDAKGVAQITHFYAALTEEHRYKTALALSRWDMRPDGTSVLYDHPDSQDVWVVYGLPNPINIPWPLGVPGIDNRVAWELINAGFKVLNPSKTIRTYHLHEVRWRSYEQVASPRLIERVPPPYSYAKPVTL